ncbi:MAG: D-alanyl-D-alanine carboxypeptidase/D-alanyl-D-alanine-endopeptidase [Paracoccaceae bacterium]
MAGVALPGMAEVIDRSPRPVARDAKAVEKPKAARDKATGPDAEALIQAAKLGGTVAFVLVDAVTGEVLEARNPDTRLPPASVAKTITSLYALEKLGPAHLFTTRVLATGPVSAGIVQGDVVLLGGGDPGLQTDQLGDLVARLAKSGVRGATGRFLVWDGALPRMTSLSPDQPPQVGYDPALSGLNLNFNRVYFEWKKQGSDWRVSMDARGEKFLPAVQGITGRVARRDAPVFTYDQAAGKEEWTVASAALGKGGSRWLPVRQPALYAGEIFRTLARAAGLTLPQAERVAAQPSGTEIGRVQSDNLTDVLRDMLKFSTNLTAECCGLTASGQRDHDASARAMTDWARTRLGMGSVFVDHSGLGSGSRVTAADLVKALMASHRQGLGLKPILRNVGMKDDTGKAIKDHPVKVLAKSGTLNFVSGLAGHIVPPSGGKWAGRELIFAIFSGDPARRDAVPVALRENPEGAEGWTRRARRLQGQLISGWAKTYV